MTTTLKLDQETAIKLYPTAVPEFKAMMEQTFGKKIFIKDITEIIKTPQDAYEYNGTTEEAVIPSAIHHLLSPREIEVREMTQITLALNEGMPPDYTNPNVKKWTPVFRHDGPEGFRFRYSGVFSFDSSAGGGSAFAFKEQRLSDYAAKQFFTKYKTIQTT